MLFQYFFNLTDPLHVFYGSWLCVFMRFLCVQAYISLHLYMHFLSFLVHFLLLAFLVLLWSVLFCLLLRSLFFLRGGKKWYGSKGKWRWEWLGRVGGGETVIRIHCMKKSLFNKNKKFSLIGLFSMCHRDSMVYIFTFI